MNFLDILRLLNPQHVRLLMRLIQDYIFFGVVGAIGFLVDVAVLYLLIGSIGLFYGRAVSFLAAVVVTWLLNRKLTFRHRNSRLESGREFTVYLTLMLIGGLVNYAVYAGLVVTIPPIIAHPFIAVAAGSLAGMLINFVTSRFFLFRHT